MKTPSNPDLLPAHERYRAALKMYKASKKVFRLARKELKAPRIAELRAKKREANRKLKKNAEIIEPHT
jgi:hypothetical protein